MTGSVVLVGEARQLLVSEQSPEGQAGEDPDDDWDADYDADYADASDFTDDTDRGDESEDGHR